MKNKKYKINIGEPWDYTNPKGEENLITGNIIRIIENKCVVFEADYLLTFNGLEGKILVLFPRHVNNFNDLNNISVNGGLYKNDAIVDNIKYMKDNSEFCIIGVLE